MDNVVRGSQPPRPLPGPLPVAGSALGGASALSNGSTGVPLPSGDSGVYGASVDSAIAASGHGKDAGAGAVTN